MNSRDRAAVDRIDAVIREIGSLTPSNPADTKAIFANLRIATAASKELAGAIAALRRQDWRFVDECLSRAERIASPRATPSSTATDLAKEAS